MELNNLEFYNVYKLRVAKVKSLDDYVLKEVELNNIDYYVKFYVCKEIFPFYVDNVLYAKNIVNDKYFIINNNSDYDVFLPRDESSLIEYFNSYKLLIQKLHAKRFIHFNITPNHLIHSNSSNNIGIKEDDKVTSFNSFLSKNPIIGSSIISPLQILLEMMNSKVENDTIPYNDFKKKFIKFYNFVSKDNLLWICQKYYSSKYGASDYIDFIINKLCVIDNNRNIVKNHNKLIPYIHNVDLFSLSMILHFYIEKLSVNSSQIVNFIVDCVCFEFIY